MEELLGEEWFDKLKGEFNKEYIINLQKFVQQRRRETTVYPKSEDVFKAYRSLPYSNVKVCILGLDPYINGEAVGIAFSTDGRWTPSLKKISDAVEKDCYNGLNLNWDNNLSRWVDQGVFLLNTILTVDKGVSSSHKGKGWEQFTLETIKELDKKGNVIFMLWGNDAKEYDKYIAKGINSVISCEHPVAASYSSRAWNNNDCFNKVNQILKDLGEEEIKW